MSDTQHARYALVVEDHPLVASSLVGCIRRCYPDVLVETVQSLAAALALLRQQPDPLLILSDLTLTDARGTEAVQALCRAAPQSPLLVVTALDEAALREAATAAGAIGYLVKSAAIESLLDQINAVLGGQLVKRPPCRPKDDSPPVLLTPKQLAVLDQLAAGRSNREIADRMQISLETVGSHMKEILGRLGVKNRTEAVIRYLQTIKPTHERRSR